MSAKRARLSFAALVLLVLGMLTATGCRACSGVVNASPGLRWWLFENYGAEQICPEMLKRGMGLRIQDRGPVVGRYFPTGCKVHVDSQAHLVTVDFNGWGYAYTPITRKVTFTTQAAIQFKPDFYLGDEDIYVWGTTNRVVSGPKFQIRQMENPAANLGQLTPLGSVANMFGNQIAAGELTRGFTVVQNWDTDSRTFGLGIIKPPYKPHTPYQVRDDEKHTYLNETVEVPWNQRDYLGPFEVVSGDQQLELRIFNRGGAAEALVIERGPGDVWRDQYINQAALTRPPGPIIGGTALPANRETRAAFRLAPGRQYYVVIDNTLAAGTVMPTGNPFTGGPTAVLSVVVQLGEVP